MRSRFRFFAALLIGAIVVAFLLPRLTHAARLWHERWTPAFAQQMRGRAVLREVAAAQEQWRLRTGTYADDVRPLTPWLEGEPGSVSFTTHGAEGWSARWTAGSTECAIWARDSTLRVGNVPEGAPQCGAKWWGWAAVHTRLVPPAAVTPFSPHEIVGEWTEHRANSQRQAVVALDSARRGGATWTTSIGGELRAPVASAGGQIFVGAHGNGEFVALHTATGAVGFRVRAPNWIHHEPVITPRLVIVGFGDNSSPREAGVYAGTPPSGVVAYDRATGVERWRRYTRGAVMTSPVLADSLVIAVTGASELIAWNAASGEERWRVALPGSSPMGNPARADSLVVVGVEPHTICAARIATGTLEYCTTLASGNGWGAGHSSVAVWGSTALLTFDDGRSQTGLAARVRDWLSRITIDFGTNWVAMPRQTVLVAVNLNDGHERWRISLGTGHAEVDGHIAGTPVVVGDAAYVTVPANGSVAAIDLPRAKVLWSAATNTARGSVSVVGHQAIDATRDSSYVVLDASNGAFLCKRRLPGQSDRAGLTIVGESGTLTLGNGTVMTRPVRDWMSCAA